MICVSLQNKNFAQLLDILDRPEVEMAEIRLDSCPLSDSEIEELFSLAAIPLVATCRVNVSKETPREWKAAWEEAARRLMLALEGGANYIDVEIEAPFFITKQMRKACSQNGMVLIRSWHDFEGTPDSLSLKKMADKCHSLGGELVKIVTTASEDADVSRVLALYDEVKYPLLAFAMGEKGRQSRIDCLKKGAPFSFACLDAADATAPGQWELESMVKEIYGDMPAYRRKGLRMPASKSFAQRAILAAALAEGESTLRGYTPCGDSEAALSLVQELGARVQREGDIIRINGGNLRPAARINVGESGLLTRLCIPVFSAFTEDDTFSVAGEGTLLRRPLDSAAAIMAAFGVILESESGDKTVKVPLRVRGHLLSGKAEVPGEGGSQLISGLMMALPLLSKRSEVYVSEPKSIPYMFITSDVLSKFGVKVASEMQGDAVMIESGDWSYCSGINFEIDGGQKYTPADIEIESDWSAAANFLVAGAIFGSVSLQGMDMSSLQADLSIIDVLVEADACVSREDESGDICVCRAPLQGFDFDLNNCPDIFPICAVLAAFCQGKTLLRGVNRLRGKESDRAAAIVEMLSAMGVECSIQGDILSIKGESLASRRLSGRLLRGGEFTTRHDHRMAMALSVAALGTESPIVMDDEACVGKSFPGFSL